jgi:TPR repeat protein
MTGDGVAADPKAAVGWYQKSATQGLAAAQNALGVAYRTGNGVAKDDGAARQWFEKAKANGSASAAASLAAMDGR